MAPFRKREVWGRPTRELMLRTAAVIGNYDYLLDWRFQQDGSIRVAVGATGIIETKGVKTKTRASMAWAATQAGAGRVRPLRRRQHLGVNHDHFFLFRLDLDVDGAEQHVHGGPVETTPIAGVDPPKKHLGGRALGGETEREAMMDMQLDKPAMWMFVNPNVHGPLGYPTGYEIMPGTTAASLSTLKMGSESRRIFDPPFG